MLYILSIANGPGRVGILRRRDASDDWRIRGQRLPSKGGGLSLGLLGLGTKGSKSRDGDARQRVGLLARRRGRE